MQCMQQDARPECAALTFEARVNGAHDALRHDLDASYSFRLAKTSRPSGHTTTGGASRTDLQRSLRSDDAAVGLGQL